MHTLYLIAETVVAVNVFVIDVLAAVAVKKSAKFLKMFR